MIVYLCILPTLLMISKILSPRLLIFWYHLLGSSKVLFFVSSCDISWTSLVAQTLKILELDKMGFKSWFFIIFSKFLKIFQL